MPTRLRPVIAYKSSTSYEHNFSPSDGSLQRGLKDCAQQQRDGAERILLERLDKILACASRLPEIDQGLLLEVLRSIMRGQILDIERFELASSLRALRSAEELEEYIYLVAGSVGEFWTKLCLRAWTRYSRTSAEKIILLGTQYGKGLQLVNILRDYPQDLRLGRSYLPVERCPVRRSQPGRTNLSRIGAPSLSVTLNPAPDTCRAIHPIRVRFACALPVLIGIETLGKMRNIPSPETKDKGLSRPSLLANAALAPDHRGARLRQDIDADAGLDCNWSDWRPRPGDEGHCIPGCSLVAP